MGNFFLKKIKFPSLLVVVVMVKDCFAGFTALMSQTARIVKENTQGCVEKARNILEHLEECSPCKLGTLKELKDSVVAMSKAPCKGPFQVTGRIKVSDCVSITSIYMYIYIY